MTAATRSETSVSIQRGWNSWSIARTTELLTFNFNMRQVDKYGR